MIRPEVCSQVDGYQSVSHGATSVAQLQQITDPGAPCLRSIEVMRWPIWLVKEIDPLMQNS